MSRRDERRLAQKEQSCREWAAEAMALDGENQSLRGILRRELKRTMTDRQREVLACIGVRSGFPVQDLADTLGTSVRNAYNFGNLMAGRGYARVDVGGRSRPGRVHITEDGRTVLRLLGGTP